MDDDFDYDTDVESLQMLRTYGKTTLDELAAFHLNFADAGVVVSTLHSANTAV